jgi:predicted HicB family RNase H-like nuclease
MTPEKQQPIIPSTQKPDRQFSLRVDPDIYRRAKAKATLEGLTMRDLFTRLLQNYLSS